MKKYLYIPLCTVLLTLCACMDNHDEPNTDEVLVTSATSVGDVNTTIGELKAKYCKNSSGADFTRNNSNFFTKIEEDVVITGVVAANDISGNLYQTILLRNIETDGTDQSIILGIKTSGLYNYFPLGQRIKVNLKNLYVGCYSKVPKIGEPYYTSYGNLNLGAMLFDRCATNIELVGKPNASAPELTPVVPTDSWLRSSSNKDLSEHADARKRERHHRRNVRRQTRRRRQRLCLRAPLRNRRWQARGSRSQQHSRQDHLQKSSPPTTSTTTATASIAPSSWPPTPPRWTLRTSTQKRRRLRAYAR